MELQNWLLTIEFDSLREQERRDPSLAFPNDECSIVIRHLMDIWGGLPEEFKEDCQWASTEIKITFEVLDNLQDSLNWIVMHTIPKRMELLRIKGV